jgi:UPF0716 family protein affecting phage T7 exclusion
MRRKALGLATGALSMFFLAPCVKAQSWQQMRRDRNAIVQGSENINQDRREIRNDVRNGEYGVAAREQQEMHRRQAANRDRQENFYR